jgi:hypothetical protein
MEGVDCCPHLFPSSFTKGRMWNLSAHAARENCFFNKKILKFLKKNTHPKLNFQKLAIIVASETVMRLNCKGNVFSSKDFVNNLNVHSNVVNNVFC